MPQPEIRPRIAAVVVNYNYEKYVAEAVDSLLAQSTSFDEILVVDDGSTDGSVEVLRSFGSRIQLIEKENGGQLSAAWTALASTDCDYLYVLDSDDVASPRLLETVAPHLATRPVKVQFQLHSMDEHGTAIDSIFPTFAPGYSQAEMIEDNTVLGFYVCPPTSGNVFRTDYLRGLASESLNEREAYDGVPAQVAPYFGPIVSLNTPLVRYRVHSQSDSQWGRPTPALLRSEMARFTSRWEESNAVLASRGYPRVPSGRSVFQLEHQLMIDALEGRRVPVSTVLQYIRLVARSGLSRSQRLAFSGWAALLLVPPRRRAASLVLSRRSSAGRSRFVQRIVRLARSTRTVS
ncbi:glycosyltransferase family 2 protein [Frondihabitans cladoniiphilus]|uniref:Glycosyltransferase 2-like domain-containing protein n=1 Tax=Frondihabitans cladoniiphilus TaxID=715785 RepID=A0ABP8VZQ7_9MICO